MPMHFPIFPSSSHLPLPSQVAHEAKSSPKATPPSTKPVDPSLHLGALCLSTAEVTALYASNAREHEAHHVSCTCPWSSIQERRVTHCPLCALPRPSPYLSHPGEEAPCPIPTPHALSHHSPSLLYMQQGQVEQRYSRAPHPFFSPVQLSAPHLFISLVNHMDEPVAINHWWPSGLHSLVEVGALVTTGCPHRRSESLGGATWSEMPMRRWDSKGDALLGLDGARKVGEQDIHGKDCGVECAGFRGRDHEKDHQQGNKGTCLCLSCGPARPAFPWITPKESRRAGALPSCLEKVCIPPLQVNTTPPPLGPVAPRAELPKGETGRANCFHRLTRWLAPWAGWPFTLLPRP